MVTKFDMGQAWAQTTAFLRSDQQQTILIAALCSAVPTLLLGWFGPQPPAPASGAAPDDMLGMMSDFYRSAAPFILISSLLSMLGSLALFRIWLGPVGETTGRALSVAGTLLLPYLLVTLLTGAAVVLGFLLFIIPGLYLLARYSVAGPAMAERDIRNPIAAIRASWQATAKCAWPILGFLIIVGLVIIVIYLVISGLFAALFGVVLEAETATWLLKPIEALLGMAVMMVQTALASAIWRQIGGSDHAEVFA